MAESLEAVGLVPIKGENFYKRRGYLAGTDEELTTFLDKAVESKADIKIGTTGRGIGPAYEDKVSRRALRVSDLFVRENFASKLGEVLDYHNFLLKNYFRAEPVDFARTLDESLQAAAGDVVPVGTVIFTLETAGGGAGSRRASHRPRPRPGEGSPPPDRR